MELNLEELRAPDTVRHREIDFSKEPYSYILKCPESSGSKWDLYLLGYLLASKLTLDLDEDLYLVTCEESELELVSYVIGLLGGWDTFIHTSIDNYHPRLNNRLREFWSLGYRADKYDNPKVDAFLARIRRLARRELWYRENYLGEFLEDPGNLEIIDLTGDPLR